MLVFLVGAIDLWLTPHVWHLYMSANEEDNISGHWIVFLSLLVCVTVAAVIQSFMASAPNLDLRCEVNLMPPMLIQTNIFMCVWTLENFDSTSPAVFTGLNSTSRAFFNRLNSDTPPSVIIALSLGVFHLVGLTLSLEGLSRLFHEYHLTTNIKAFKCMAYSLILFILNVCWGTYPFHHLLNAIITGLIPNLHDNFKSYVVRNYEPYKAWILTTLYLSAFAIIWPLSWFPDELGEYVGFVLGLLTNTGLEKVWSDNGERWHCCLRWLERISRLGFLVCSVAFYGHLCQRFSVPFDNFDQKLAALTSFFLSVSVQAYRSGLVHEHLE